MYPFCFPFEEQAIHPGYGFISESPEFSQLCREHSIKFIGPSPESMQLMSSKKCSVLARG